MIRPVLSLACALLVVVPSAAQSNGNGGITLADPAGFPDFGSDESRYNLHLPFCSLPLDVWGLIILNICTGEVELNFPFLYALGTEPLPSGESLPAKGRIHPNLLPALSGRGTPMGVGSEGVTTAALANGNHVAAWLSSTRLNTGIFTLNSTALATLAQYNVGPTPEHVIAADFNGDGKVDLAVSNFGSLSTSAGGNVMIFLGNGDGTFTPGATINSPTPVALYAADFNGDGKLDLAVANVDPADTVSILLGNGDGTFQAPAAYPVPISPASLTAADFDGDGHLDLAVANGYSGGISILLGNGNGTFQAARGYPAGNGQSTYLAWFDLNGDGKLDLIVANPQSNGISFLFGNGDGSFKAPVEYATGARPQVFALLPLNGKLLIGTTDTISGDLVVMTVLPGGLAGAPPVYQAPQAVTGVAAADLSGDGFPDIVAAAGSLSVALRVPAGAFQAPVNYPLQSGSAAVAVAVADLDGDGKRDVVAASFFTDQNSNYGGAVDVAFNNGNGTLGTQASYAIGGYPGGFEGAVPSGVVAFDFNGDGKRDVAAGYQAQPGNPGAGGISVLINNGNGTLKPAVNYPVGGFSVFCTIAADFNGDSKLDLAACGGATAGAFTPGAVGVLLGNGDGTFQNAALTQVGSPAGTPLALAAGDVDRDGHTDLVVSVQDASFNHTIVVLVGNGNGTFHALTPFPISVQGSALALADLNGDGILDLIVGDCCGLSESVYLLGNGDGTFQAAHYFSSGASVTGFAVTDWNADGIAGLAIAQKGGTVEAMESALNPRLYSTDPTLSITKSHAGSFAQGQQGATYTITVSNASGAAPVAGNVTVTDTVPSALTLVSMAGTGWTCSSNACTRNDALAGGGAYPPITATVNVSASAASPQVNMATVSGGGSASASATDSTVLTSTAAPVLSIVSSHAGNFAPGQQGATYTVTVSNAAGAASTSGTVHVTETVPSGLTLVSMAGTGWSCSANACSRTDSLAAGASYPVIIVTVNVNAGATSPQVNAVAVSGGGAATASATDSTVIATATAGLALFPVTPCRVADTRGGNGGILAAGSSRAFQIANVCNIPTAAQAYSLNITVVPPAPLTYLTAWPTGQAQPFVSTLNSFNGVVVANAAIVPAGANGAVSIFVSDATHVIIDINGYFAPPALAGLAFYPVTPCRVADTRNTGGAFSGSRNFAVPSSACAIPAAAQAYSLNMTAVPPGPLTYLTTWPAGQTQPLVSTLNAFQGQIVANAAIVPAGSGGAISVFVSDPSNVIVDINGDFAPPGGAGALYFYPVTPCRVADTRNATGTFGGPSLAAGATRSFPLPTSACGIPSTAQAYSLNMTAVPAGSLFYLTTWPAGQSQPVVSTLNDLQGQVVANAAIVPAGTSGGISVFASDATNLVIDINGYFGQ